MENNNNICVTTSDILDANVKAITIMVSARGHYEEAPVRDMLRSVGLSENQLPPHVCPNTALKRAMVDLARGNKEESVLSSGRGSSAVYTVAETNLSRIDLEADDGLGITDAKVSARVQVDPGNNDAYYLRISPPDHPAAPYIRQRFDEHCGQLSSTYDLKVWWTQRFMGSIGAMRTGRALGEYVVEANEDTARLLLRLKQGFSELPDSGKFRIYLRGETGDSADAVDMITDAILEEAERVSKHTLDALQKKVGSRGLNTHAQNAVALHGRLEKLGESFGASLDDVTEVIKDLQKRIGMSMAALATME